MRLKIDKDEWYPVFSLEDLDYDWTSREVEVDPALYERYQRAYTEWEAVQELLGEIHDAPLTAHP